jgi:PAS domain S-box-containing protein
MAELIQRANDGEARLRAIVDNVVDGIVSFDQLGVIDTVNPAMSRIFGYTPSEMGARDIKLFIPDAVSAALALTALGEGREGRELAAVRSDGSLFPIELTVSETRTQGGKSYMAVVRDVSARRAAEQLVHENLSLLQSIMDSMSSTLFVRDITGHYLFTNREYERVHKIPRDSLIGKTPFEVFPREFAEASRALDLKVIASGVAQQTQSVFMLDDGEHVFDTIRTPLYRSTGEIYGVCAVGIDISGRLQFERKLRESQVLLLGLMDSTSSIVFIRDLQGRYLFANRQYMKVYGLELDAWQGKKIEGIVPADEVDAEYESDRQVAATRHSIQYERHMTDRDGERIYASIKSPLYDENGVVYAISVVCTDITQRKRGEELTQSLNRQLARTTALHQAILDGANFSIIATDMHGVIQLFSAGAEHMLGYKARDVVGRYTPDFVHDHEELAAKSRQLSLELMETIKPGFDTLIAKVRGGGYEQQEWTYIRKDGQRFPVLLSVTALFDEGGNVSGFLGIAHDLSLQKRIERLKAEFISTVTHELRTPLTSIRGSLGLLASGKIVELPDRARYLLDIAKNNCERLVRLISDILDIERIESGNMRFDLQQLAMQPLVEQSISATQAYADQYQVKFDLQMESEELIVRADADRLVQVIVNLLSNACKFSPPGGVVTVCLKRLGNGVRLSVIDRGGGVPDDFRERIFHKFAQADASDTRQKGGTGLGLNISKTIIEAHQGRIDFVSETGKGAEFFFDLPLCEETETLAMSAAMGETSSG